MTLAECPHPSDFVIGQITAEVKLSDADTQFRRIAIALRDYYADQAVRTTGMVNGLLAELNLKEVDTLNALIANLPKGTR